MQTVKTPLKAIRAKCLDCSNGQIAEVRECVIMECPLWPYRLGMRPETAEKRAEKKADESKARNSATDGSGSEKVELRKGFSARKAIPEGGVK